MITTKDRLLRIRDLKEDKYQTMLDIRFLRSKILELKEEIKQLNKKIEQNNVIFNALINFPNFKKKMKILCPVFTIILLLITLIDYKSMDILRIVKFLGLYSTAELATYFLIIQQEKKTFKGYTEEQLRTLIDDQTITLETKTHELAHKQELKGNLICQKNAFSDQITKINMEIHSMKIIRYNHENLSPTNDILDLNKVYCLKRNRHKNNISR